MARQQSKTVPREWLSASDSERSRLSMALATALERSWDAVVVVNDERDDSGQIEMRLSHVTGPLGGIVTVVYKVAGQRPYHVVYRLDDLIDAAARGDDAWQVGCRQTFYDFRALRQARYDAERRAS